MNMLSPMHSLIYPVHATLSHPCFKTPYPYAQETLLYARPAFPICKISPVKASSLRSTGHEAPSALINVSSSLDPITLNVDLAVSMAPYRGKSAVYRFGGESDVFRSKATCFS
jgi:hypothetical protein